MTDNKTYLNWDEIRLLAEDVIAEIFATFPHENGTTYIWGIPTGGQFAAGYIESVARSMGHPGHRIRVTTEPDEANLAVDDIIDSGATRDRVYREQGLRTFALVDKTAKTPHAEMGWVVFPWEPDEVERDHQDIVRRQLQAIGEDPNRNGLIDTPDRVVRSWNELYSGYGDQPDLKWFDADADEMVVVRDITVYSTCEHHMLPFFGTATVAYIPGGEVVGVSKIARLVKHHSRRLQIQERLTQDIGKALMARESVLGAAVSITAKHLCMMARGVEEQRSVMDTTWLGGAIREKPDAKAEFVDALRRRT